jgi:hypothetical protein
VTPAVDVAECVERLLHGFTTYDRAVDVVSAFEMLFTSSRTEVSGTVRHFERFPRIPDGLGGTLTPDFTVVFKDATGLAGEIARLAMHERSADKVCSQIEKYDQLRQLPVDGGLTEVKYTDVLLLVPQSVGVAAVKRIVVDRFAEPSDPYKPSVAPCVVQFAFDEDRYIFQRLLEPRNGTLRDGERADGLGRWFEENGDVKARPARFSDIKAARAFINDPADRLYLATHLWSKTFPTAAGDVPRPVRLELRAAGWLRSCVTGSAGCWPLTSRAHLSSSEPPSSRTAHPRGGSSHGRSFGFKGRRIWRTSSPRGRAAHLLEVPPAGWKPLRRPKPRSRIPLSRCSDRRGSDKCQVSFHPGLGWVTRRRAGSCAEARRLPCRVENGRYGKLPGSFTILSVV